MKAKSEPQRREQCEQEQQQQQVRLSGEEEEEEEEVAEGSALLDDGCAMRPESSGRVCVPRVLRAGGAMPLVGVPRGVPESLLWKLPMYFERFVGRVLRWWGQDQAKERIVALLSEYVRRRSARAGGARTGWGSGRSSRFISRGAMAWARAWRWICFGKHCGTCTKISLQQQLGRRAERKWRRV